MKEMTNIRNFLILAFLFSISFMAYAEPRIYYRLRWEGTPDETFEIEISDENKAVLTTEQTKDTFYKFFIDKPAVYNWRVRKLKNNRWGPFSDYGEIQALDKVTKMTSPLMTAPKSRLRMEASFNGTPITFKWKEEFKDLKYQLEFYNIENGKPFKVIDVKGGSHTEVFSNPPKRLYWRISAKSRFNNFNANKDKFVLGITPVKDLPSKYNVYGAFYYTKTKVTQDYGNAALPIPSEVSFSGPTLNAGFEYFLKGDKYKRSVILDVRRSSLTNGDDKLEDLRLLAEYGILNPNKSKSQHNFYIGLLRNSLKLDIGSDLAANYSLNFASGRYYYQGQFAPRYDFEINAAIFAAVPLPTFAPSYFIKPGVNYQFSDHWYFNVFGMMERYVTKGDIDVGGTTEKITVDIQNFALALGFTWKTDL